MKASAGIILSSIKLKMANVAHPLKKLFSKE